MGLLFIKIDSFVKHRQCGQLQKTLDNPRRLGSYEGRAAGLYARRIKENKYKKDAEQGVLAPFQRFAGSRRAGSYREGDRP
jgi:hypothetical protein